MKTLSTLPLLLALGVGVLFVTATANRTVAAPSAGPAESARALRYVRFGESSPYTVPAGTRLVLTGLGTSACSVEDFHTVSIDGQLTLTTWLGDATGRVVELAAGFVVAEGSTVAVASCGEAAAWGYLTRATH